MAEKREILLVDDDLDFAKALAARLDSRGSNTAIAGTAAEAIEFLKGHPLTEVVLLDITLPDTSGMDLIHEISRIDSTLPIIMVTGDTQVDTAIDAIKRGAYDYVMKPIDFDPFLLRVERAIESHKAFRMLSRFESEMSKSYGFSQFVYASDAMGATVEHLRQLATSDATVLITGESGVGKELAARTLHFNGPRRHGPFVTVSCAAVPETLMENELFGHEKGAFTDAHERQIGKFELANGGTIFLDEIGDLSPVMQTKLLRVLQERSFHRIGGVREVRVDVRIIAATNRDLSAAVAEKSFRSDLYYRISVLPIAIPPLRERREDIDLLATYFLKSFSNKTAKPFTEIADDAVKLLNSYSWPGNVRELQNTIERAVVFGTPPLICSRDISVGTLGSGSEAGLALPSKVESLKDVESAHIARALEHFGWNISKAAHRLGIGRDTLYRKIKQYNIKEK